VDLLARQPIGLARGNRDRLVAVEDESLLALVDEPDLLVVVAVFGDDRPRRHSQVLDAHFVADGELRQEDARFRFDLVERLARDDVHTRHTTATAFKPTLVSDRCAAVDSAR